MEFSCFSSRLVLLLEKVDSVCLLIPNQTLYYVESLDIAVSFYPDNIFVADVEERADGVNEPNYFLVFLW